MENLHHFNYKPATLICKNGYNSDICMVLSEVLDYSIEYAKDNSHIPIIGGGKPKYRAYVRIYYDFKPYNLRTYEIKTRSKENLQTILTQVKEALEGAKKQYLETCANR